MGAGGGAGGAGYAGSLACPLVAGVRLFGVQDLPEVGSGPLVVFPPFCPLFCFALVALLANMPLFAFLMLFLARFMGFMCVCAALVLFVACVAFVRVWS